MYNDRCSEYPYERSQLHCRVVFHVKLFNISDLQMAYILIWLTNVDIVIIFATFQRFSEIFITKGTIMGFFFSLILLKVENKLYGKKSCYPQVSKNIPKDPNFNEIMNWNHSWLFFENVFYPIITKGKLFQKGTLVKKPQLLISLLFRLTLLFLFP